jgi:uncharacterized iron-regulated membrane protein
VIIAASLITTIAAYKQPPRDETTLVSAKSKSNPLSRHYNLIWRWHFYAGLIVLPVVLTLAITGGLYLFQDEIEGWLYKDRLYLQAPYVDRIDHDAVIDAARREFSAAEVHSYQPPISHEQSAQVVLTAQSGEKLTTFVHPGNYQVLGAVDESSRLMNVARELHKGLMLGTVGRYVTELVACWTIILLITGLYLWWPRGNKKRGVTIPNTSASGRNLWREFHAVPGAWVSLWVLALLFTGLPWSVLWGGLLDKAAQKAGEGFPPAIFESRPLSVSDSAEKDVSMNALVAKAGEKGAHHAFKIDYPWDANGSYALMPLRHCESDERVHLFFDRRDGRILDEYRWKDMGKVGRLTTLGVAFHEGRLFGRANQLLNAFAVLTVILLCITGPLMWWKRKPKGELGAPIVPASVSFSRPFIVFIVLAGALLPLFGVSALLIWLWDVLAVKAK